MILAALETSDPPLEHALYVPKAHSHILRLRLLLNLLRWVTGSSASNPWLAARSRASQTAAVRVSVASCPYLPALLKRTRHAMAATIRIAAPPTRIQIQDRRPKYPRFAATVVKEVSADQLDQTPRLSRCLTRQ